jgi:DNA-binding CsgD family transcriptional regulator
LTKPDFSIRKFRLIENKIISFFQYNQVSEAWNIPDFFSLYKLAHTKDKRIKMPDCIRQSFVSCFYQQKIRDYLFENKPKMKFPLFFVSLKRRMKSGFSDELYLNSQVALTRKENEVAQLLKNGYTYSDIASILCISVNTVKSHANSIYKKLGITGRYDLVASQG